jgi:two-component system phosphate regulon response regulator PhoB
MRLGLNRAPQRVVVSTGPLTIDAIAHRVLVGERRVELTSREWDVLLCLARRFGERCSYDEIATSVWGGSHFIADGPYANAHPERHLVRVNVSRIRAKLGAAGRLIRTAHGGFCLDAEPPSVGGAS